MAQLLPQEFKYLKSSKVGKVGKRCRLNKSLERVRDRSYITKNSELLEVLILIKVSNGN